MTWSLLVVSVSVLKVITFCLRGIKPSARGSNIGSLFNFIAKSKDVPRSAHSHSFGRDSPIWGDIDRFGAILGAVYHFAECIACIVYSFRFTFITRFLLVLE